MATAAADGADLVTRLLDATNAHDLERLVDCFTESYVNHTPSHPARGFTGRDQVRRNWTQIFAAVPDLAARVLATAPSPDGIWTEWEMSGRRKDGADHLMRGVIIFEIDTQQHRARAARFYLEPVDHDQLDADTAVREIVAGP